MRGGTNGYTVALGDSGTSFNDGLEAATPGPRGIDEVAIARDARVT